MEKRLKQFLYFLIFKKLKEREKYECKNYYIPMRTKYQSKTKQNKTKQKEIERERERKECVCLFLKLIKLT
jgi:hypothetical protein